MALYPEITTIAGLTAGVTTPNDDEVIVKLPSSIRQLKHFLSHFLSVAFNDDGTIKATSTITIPALSVTAGMLANDAVTTAKILDGNVTHEKLGADCVKTENILNGTILGEDVAAATITLNKLNADVVAAWVAAIAASVPADNSITAVKLKVPTTVPTTSTPVVPVLVGTSSANSTMAKIGGVLTAVLTPDISGGGSTLVFSLVGASGTSSGAGDTLTGQAAGFSTGANGRMIGATGFVGSGATWTSDYNNVIVTKESSGILRILAAGVYDVTWDIVWSGQGTVYSWVSHSGTEPTEKIIQTDVADIGPGTTYHDRRTGTLTVTAAAALYLWYGSTGSLTFVGSHITINKRA